MEDKENVNTRIPLRIFPRLSYVKFEKLKLIYLLKQ